VNLLGCPRYDGEGEGGVSTASRVPSPSAPLLGDNESTCAEADEVGRVGIGLGSETKEKGWRDMRPRTCTPWWGMGKGRSCRLSVDVVAGYVAHSSASCTRAQRRTTP